MENQIANLELNTEVNNEVAPVEVDQYEALKGLKFNAETFRSLIDMVKAQADRIAALESKNQTSSTKREMTPADAEAVMIGEHRELSHNAAAKLLGLTYGQVYSARLGHTFKPVTVEMAAQKLANIWLKSK